MLPAEKRAGYTQSNRRDEIRRRCHVGLPLTVIVAVFSVLLFALPTLAQTTSNLGVANDYNLFIFQNVTSSNSDTEGRLAIGGDATFSNYDFAGHIGNYTGTNVVVGGKYETTGGQLHGTGVVNGIVKLHNPTVYGDVKGNQSVAFDQYGTVNGNVKYGTTYSKGNTTVSGTASAGTTALPFSFSTEQSNLTALSTSLKNLTANGTVTYQYGGLTLVGTSATRNVFNVPGSQLNNCNSFVLQVPAGSTVVVNVNGTTDRMQYFGFSYTGAARNYVLFNFHQATSLSFSGIGIEGSVLAPLAAVTFSNGNLNGTLIANSMTGSGQFNWYPFLGNLGLGGGGSSPALASLTITPATVTGGTSTIGTVALTAAAPAGGATVTLASNNGAASAPASVTIPAGASSANFTINTSSVTSTTTVTISGTYAGVTKTAGLIINAPPAVTNLSLSPIQVVGGSSSTGTVTIAGLAPAGGVTVSLSSNSTSATVPASVVVPAGAASATFTVSTSSVAAQTTATISASANSGVATAQLIITSPTLLSLTLSPTTVKGGASSTGTVTLSSPAPTGGLSVSLTTASPASVPGSVVVPAGATSATFTVTTVAVAINTTATVTGSAGGVSKSATLTVTAPTLLSLTLSPASVNAGEPSTGTVTISDPAPSGGLTVTLASSSTFATVPANVSIPAGATSATFAVSTSDVPATTTATVTGSLNGVNKSASLEIVYVPPTLLSLTVAPATVKGGQSSTGTVTISKAAPAGGTTITLASDNAAATTPSSVTVAAGATTATFTISTVAVPANVTATISASLGGVTKTAPLTITAPKLLTLTLNPTSVEGGQSSTGTVTISDPAPSGGLTVALASSNAAATTPASVTIPAGATSADFTVATSVVTAETMAIITGTLNGDSASATLTIRYIPPTPKLTLTVSPNQLLGGLTARGTVTLVGNVAPTGGMVIQLASSDSAATVPATVTIPAGETSASFDIPTTVVLAQRVATLTATGNGGSATATLTILPAPCVESASLVQSISFATNPIIGGREVKGTVTLTGPAVAGGQAILLASNDPTLVPVPAAIFIEGGQTTGTFTINTAPVNLMSWVTVSAGYHASVASATLTLNPGPESGSVGGGGMGSDGPSLTPAALAAGYRLVPFLSGFPPAQLGYGFLSFTSSPDSSIIGLVGNVGQESIKLPNRNYLAYTDKLPYTTSGILGVRSGDGLYQNDFDSGFWRIGTDGNRLSRLVAGGTIRGGAQDANPNTGGILVSGQFASGVLYPAVEVDILTGEWHIVAPGQGSGAGAAFSEDGSLLFRKQFSGIEILEYGTSALLSFIAQGGHGIAVGTGSLTNMVYTMDHDLIQVNTATGEKTTIVQGNGALGSQLPSYDGEGNLFLAYNDRAMRLYPPLGAYFGTRLPEQIITRDDKNASYAPLSLSGTNYSGDLANAAAFDLSGVVGGIQAAQVLRAGAITHGFEGTLDAQLGVRSLLGGTITSYATPIPSVEKLASPYNYSQSWALPEVFYPELRLALGGLYTLGLTDKASGICGTWLFGDTPNASWPGSRNQLTLKLSPRGLPITMPGRVVGLTLPRPSRPVRGPWEIWQGQTLIASALAPNGWDVEDDHTIYAGVAVTVPGAANTATYEVRFVGAAAPRGGAGSFRVLASSALAPTLKPLALSSSSVAGGATVTALVELDAPAPAGGATVALSSRGGGISHPDRVDIPAGATSATFVISTQPGAATARIQASYNGYRVARLRIDGGAPLPPGLGLLSVIVAPGIVIGGQDTSLTATLSGPAPDGGLLVNLASSGPEAILPAQLYVPEGATVASTAVQTTQVATTTNLILTGELNGTSKTAQLTLVGQVTAPTVVITAPEDGMTFRVPNRSLNIGIRAAATVGAGATLQKIELFANGNKIATIYGQNPVIHTQNFTPGVYELQARAVDSFGQASLSEKVTIYLNDSFFQTPRPQIRPRGGNYTGPQTITITVPNPGFDPWNPVIYYTLDGSDPAVNGLRYTGPFVILSDTTVKAVARFADWAVSPQASESYVISGGGGGPGDDNLTAVITAPADGNTITQPSQVTGTITSTNGAGWRLWYRLAGEITWQPLASGMAAPGAQTISTRFDPTLVLNGTYQLFLEARTVRGNTASDLTSFIVEGNMKIGNFKLSFTDLVVPIAGIPITVTRSYDTLDKRTGDFGVGWTLQMSNIRLQKSVPIHDFWEERADQFDLLGTPAYNFFFRQSKKHYITITFPSGEVYRFAAVYSPQFQGLSPINAARLDWVPVGRTRGSLRPTAEIGQNPNATNVLVAPLGGGFYNNPDWTDMELIGYGDGNGTSGEYEPTEFELTTLDGTVWIIDEKKGLVKVTEPNGHALTYGPNGIVSNLGLGVTFLRDGAGRITSITDPNGNVLRYQIDGNGDLTGFTDRENKTTTFGYAAGHNLSFMRDTRGVNLLRNDFSDTGRLVLTRDAQDFASTFVHGIDDPTVPDNQEIVRDRLGNRMVQSFDGRGNIVGVTRFLKLPNGTERPISTSSDFADPNWPDKPTSTTDALGGTTTYEYDNNGYLIKVTDALGNSKTATFDAAGRPLTVTDALGNTTVKTYDAKGNLLTTTDALGRTTTNAYDAQGRLTSATDALGSTRSYTYDVLGRVLTDTDPLGHTVTYTYDALGRRLTESMPRTNAQGMVETLTTGYTYDNEGRTILVLPPDGTNTRTTYDGDGRVVFTYDQVGRRTEYQYTARGQQSAVIRPDGTVSLTRYDAEGRVDETQTPRGLITKNFYDSLGRTVRMEHRNLAGAVLDASTTTYNDASEVVASTDARGFTTTYQYDAVGRQTRATDVLGNFSTPVYNINGWMTSSTDALGRVSTMVYDALGRVTSSTSPVGTSTSEYDEIGRVVKTIDPAGRVTQSVYDRMNRVTKVIDSGGFETTFGYDELGQKIRQTDANGHSTFFAYDNMGRMVARQLPMGQVETSAYLIDGRLATHTDFNNHTTTYNYDAPTGRLLSKVGYNGESVTYSYMTDGLLNSATRNGTLTTTYGYDVFGRTTSIASPAGTISYGYDVAGNRTSMVLPSATIGFEYDELGRMKAVVHPGGGKTRYTYNAVGNRASKILANGLTTTYGYDNGNRLVAVNNPIGSSFAYTLDASGKRLSVVDSLLGTTTYSYDGLGRLTGESGPAGNIGYSYDAVGNRQSKTVNGVSVGYTYDANDRMLSEGTKTFGYDGNGNTTSADGQTLTYDFENRLVSTTGGTSGATQYVYDASGNRIQRIVGGSVSSYLVDTLGGYGNVVEERGGLIGNLVARYDYGVDLARMDRAGIGGGTRYYLHDGLGSVVALSDPAGAVTDRWGYDAYGNPTRLEGTTTNPFLFNGQQYDSEEGLYFLRARYYAPSQGRFLTHDPLMGNSGDPQSLHRYLYANADPVNFTDPTGMFSLGETLATADLAPGVRALVGTVHGMLAGQLMGSIYAAGRYSILKYDPMAVMLEAALAGLQGTVIGGVLGGVTAYVSSVAPIAGTGISIVAGIAGVAYQGSAVAEDLGNYDVTGDRRFKSAAAWDALWGAFAVKGIFDSLSTIGCFTEDATVTYFIAGSPMEHSGSIKDLVRAWESGASISVRARDEKSGKEEVCKVTNAWERTVTDVVTVEFADKVTSKAVEVLTGTLEHPFMTPNGWIGMGSLGIGTEILTRAGPRLMVRSTIRQHFENGVKVYNFTVDGKHTYFVGNLLGGYWVHNADCSGETSSTLAGKVIHKRIADARRTSGNWDLVSQPITTISGDEITVPYAVDLKTGQPRAGTRYQKAVPDAVSYSQEIIVDDKPFGRNIARDRQEMIRNIKAYEIRTGKLPKEIQIHYYNPDGSLNNIKVYFPSDFLP